ncbi:MAG: transketolase [Spirochaetaceae bacterium]|nr:MAG: transketolase [Spirochaetaceae bacterium]
MDQSTIDAIALSVRSLSMDAVQAANSGHPGLPMGCAELGALLYGEVLTHCPTAPDWPNRDRFVLSAGHGSMFLYSLLHLSGYDLPLDELKRFRQVGSKTPGHPEFGHTVGVETTTGPLGQGISNAVGIAIAERMTAATYNTGAHTIVDHYTYVLAGDGDMMEGISSEACSLAGHLKLGKLVVFYDDNDISIDGSTDITFTEDVGKRFDAYGWQVLNADPYDGDSLRAAIQSAKQTDDRPSLIVMKTVIGKGSPNMAGTAKVHGAPLGKDEVAATRKALGIPEDHAFYIHPDASAYFDSRRGDLQKAYATWGQTFKAWRSANPELAERWDRTRGGSVDYLKAVKLPDVEIGSSVATRKASSGVLAAIADAVPSFVGGSADLEGSNLTGMPGHGVFTPETPAGRTIRFGVREHAMGAVTNGIALYGGFRPFCATFLVFSDYMRPSIRLAALMGLPVVYVFTHDSIFVGEDGPTHQPVEHTVALRSIPNLAVLRPADAEETAEAWLIAMERTDGPTALVLTRQNLKAFAKPAGWKGAARKGAYVALDCDGTPEVIVAATGSEVPLAIDAAAKSARKVRVVSIVSHERLREQGESYRVSLFPAGVRVITAEVGIGLGWEGIASSARDVFSLDRFGASGPGDEVADHLGFNAAALAKLIEA